ncbi:hypothetical protein [Salarchaeum japonicum]|mgnify:CR=1 FL=1|uniref:hypothetical protein n=1 Tax=Salarchaeum japonicum TaxID=555573 RepID=UPI003C7645A4
MKRRGFLAATGTGVAGALAGCSGALSTQSPEWRLRAMAITESTASETDTTCTLNEPFVEAYPNLQNVLALASQSETGEWQAIPVELEPGNELGDALYEFCGGSIRGAYYYKDQPYYISLVDTRPENGKGHGAHDH